MENHMLKRKKLAAGLVSVIALGAVAANVQTNADAAVATRPIRSSDVTLPTTDGVQLVVAPTGNEVRYRVREQLVGLDLPNYAVGATSEVTGGMSFDARGTIVPAASKFMVNI
jgi:hypothetical protein